MKKNINININSKLLLCLLSLTFTIQVTANWDVSFTDDLSDNQVNWIEQTDENFINETSCYSNDDNDNISNDINLCSDKPFSDTVDMNIHGFIDTNVAPEVHLSMTQNNIFVSIIDIADGIVEITASTSDANVDDMLSFSWILRGSIPALSINNNRISFDPISMVADSPYSIGITVSDNSNPKLLMNKNIEFIIKNSQLLSVSDKSERGGGSINYLVILALFICMSRVINKKSLYNCIFLPER